MDSLNLERKAFRDFRELTCVCVKVRLQDSGRHKGSPTEVTSVWFLPSVGAHVLLEMARLFEAFIAPIAPEEGKYQSVAVLFFFF